MLVPVVLPDCWGVDFDFRPTEEQYRKLWTYDLRTVSWSARKASPAAPVFPDFAGRYGPLYGNGVGEDLTSGELVVGAQTCAEAGRRGGIFMFQHVRAGEKVQQNGKVVDIGWVPTDDMGPQDAQTIVGYADSIGYSVTYASDATGPLLVPHIGQDMENLRAGHSGFTMAQKWRDFVASALRVQPFTYNGFDPGITPEQFAALGNPIARDAGARQPPPGVGFFYEQHESVTIPGFGQVDIAHAHPDLMGRSLVVMGWAPDPSSVPTDAPAV